MTRYTSIVLVRILIVVITLAIGIGLNSCGNNVSNADRKNGFTTDLKTKEDSLFHGVMAGHDAGMAKMGKVSGLIKAVKHQLDSIQQLPAAARAGASQYQSALNATLTNLQQAEAGMNEWMEKFSLDSAKDNPTARIQYLESEREAVNKVRDQMANSIRIADSVLKR
jgi:hypothetical protein